MLSNLEFMMLINASCEKVWNVLWNDDTYRQWTAVFSEGSHAVSNWNEGDRIHFLSGGGEGMYSVIEKKVVNAHMAFKHLGVIKEGKEMPIDEETQQWSGSHEIYNLSESNGATWLRVNLTVAENYRDYFSNVFPKALEKVKEIAEK